MKYPMIRYEHASICLNDIRFYGYHGMTEEERRVGNHFSVCVRMEISVPSEGFSHDSLDRSVNYAEAYQVIKDVFLEPSQTLEHLATCIIEALFSSFPVVDKVDMEIEKIRPPFPSDCHSASVRMTASRCMSRP